MAYNNKNNQSETLIGYNLQNNLPFSFDPLNSVTFADQRDLRERSLLSKLVLYENVDLLVVVQDLKDKYNISSRIVQRHHNHYCNHYYNHFHSSLLSKHFRDLSHL